MKYFTRSVRNLSILASLLGLFLLMAANSVYADGPQEIWRQQSADNDPNLFSGAATYSVPLTIPEGRNGLTPDINLYYSSLNGDPQSMVGKGWDLGLTRVVRDQRTSVMDLYSDGNFRLEMNGSSSQLQAISLSSGEYGTYGADVEGDFYYIEFHSDDSWTVTTKQGLEMTLGASASARIDNPADADQIYAWYLEDVRDLNDNYIAYEYYIDTAAIYPKQILYTGHDTTDGPFTVRFEPFATGTPSARDDVTSSYFAGFEIEYQYLIESIEVDVDGETYPVIEYAFDYDAGENGATSLLASITPSGRDSNDAAISLEPWELTYSTGTTSWTEDTGYTFPESPLNNDSVAMADFNGDGMADTLRIWNTGSGWIKEVWANETDGYVDDSSNWTLPEQDFYGRNTVVADLNNDGYTDYARSINQSSSQYWIYLNDGDGTFTNASASWSVPSVVDFDHDDLKFLDVNGDGILDIMWVTGCSGGTCNYSYVFEGDGETGWTDATANYTPPTKDLQYYFVLDANNDGLDDFLRLTNTGSQVKYLFLNEGDGTFLDASSIWTLPDIHADTIADVDGDGLIDIFLENRDYYYRNTGSGWEYEDLDTDDSGELFTSTRLVDIDGDTLTDYFRVHWTGSSWITTLMTHDGERSDLLQTVTNPQGGELTYTYEGTAEMVDASDDRLNPDLPFVFPVVSSMEADDGLSTTYTTDYEYAGGAFTYTDVYDGAFAGFNAVTKTKDDDSYEIRYYHQGGGVDGSADGEYSDHIDKKGRIYKIETYSSGDTLDQDVVMKWDRSDLGNDRAFVFLAQQGTRTYNPDTSSRDTATAYTYDSYGNLTSTTEYGEATVSDAGTISDIGTDKRTINDTYVTTTSPYLVGLRAQETVKDYSDTTVAGTQWRYDDESYQSATVGNVTSKLHLIDTTFPNIFAIEEWTYDTYGNQLTYTDPEDNETAYSYDAYNMYPDEIENAKSQTSYQTVDLTTGQVTWSEDPNGLEHEYYWDTFGRPEEEKIMTNHWPKIMVKVREYDYVTTSTPNQTVVTSHDKIFSSTSSYKYVDGFGRTVQTRTPLEIGYAVIDIAYDQQDRQVSVSQPYASAGTSYTTPSGSAALVETTYDALGRITAISDDVGTSSLVYDDWAQTVTDEEDNDKTYYYDAFGNLVQVDENESANTFTTEYEYDTLGNLTLITDDDSNEQEMTYDLLGRRLSKTTIHDPAGGYGTWTYDYDDVGNMVEMVDSNGVTTAYTYDELNRLLTENADDVAGTEVSYTYDTATNGVGKIDEVTNFEATTVYEYDLRGRLTSETLTIDGSTYDPTEYTYDRLDRVLTVTYPNDKVKTITYNDQGLPETLELDSTDILTDIDYNPNGQPTYLEYDNGVTTTNTYDVDARYWLTDKVTTNGADTFIDNSYTYDDVGNITQIVDDSDLETVGTYAYAYDDLYRLTDADWDSSTSTYADYSKDFAYNAIGNMTSSTDVGSMTYGSGAHPHALTSSSLGTWSYDDNGNLEDDGTYTYTWNYQNQLVTSDDGVDTTEYWYDYQGNRVQKETPGDETKVYLGEYIELPDTDDAEIHITILGQPVFEWQDYDDTPEIAYIHADHLGSVAVMTDDSGDWTVSQDYLPYGEVRVYETNSPDLESRFDFSDKERDTETGLNYFEARYLSTAAGRFVSQDPWEGDLQDPQSLNRYAYAGNNPISYMDPNGKWKKYYDKNGNFVKKTKNGGLFGVFKGNKSYIEGSSSAPVENDGKNYWEVEKVAGEALESGNISGVVENTDELIDDFVSENHAGLNFPYNAVEVMANSPEGQSWDMKNSSYLSNDQIYVYEDTGRMYDYIGNVAWGQIMSDAGWSEDIATMGAGLYQLSPFGSGNPVFTNPQGFFDDHRDTKAIKEGYDK